jgi:hypothetical protein
MSRNLEIRIRASSRPRTSESTIPIAAIRRLIAKPSSRKRKLLLVHATPVVGIEQVAHRHP